MKFGFDIHGVLDTHSEVYATLTTALMHQKHEIHVITGTMKTPELVKQLTEAGICWSHWFSIVEYHMKAGQHKVTWDENDHPWMEQEVWDRTKADYCERVGIDLMIDDSPAYGNYFNGKTVFLLQKDIQAQKAWDVLAKGES